MDKRSYSAGHFELAVGSQRIGRFETLLAPTATGGPPRSLLPQEIIQLLFPQDRADHRTLILKKGRGDAMTLRNWSGSPIPRALSIAVLGPTGQPAARYHLEKAWPAKWYVPAAAPGGGEVAIEEVVIAYERLRHG